MIASLRLRSLGCSVVLLASALLGDIHAVVAFCPTSALGTLTEKTNQSPSFSPNNMIQPSHFVNALFETALMAKKTPKEPEREKKDALGLLILYMTPWKNPNSIFVYMLLLLYGLGTYSEAQAAARMAGM